MARISATFCSHHCQRAINFYFRATRTCATFFSAVALKVAQVPSTVDLVQSRELGVVGSINMQSRVSFALSSERGEILVSYSLVKISWLGLKRTSEPSCQASWVAASSQDIEFSLAPSRLKVSHTPRQAGVLALDVTVLKFRIFKLILTIIRVGFLLKLINIKLDLYNNMFPNVK